MVSSYKRRRREISERSRLLSFRSLSFSSEMLMTGGVRCWVSTITGNGDDIGEETGDHACSSIEVDGDSERLCFADPEHEAGCNAFRLYISQRRCRSPRRKKSFANSHRSGTTFLNPCHHHAREEFQQRIISFVHGHKSRARGS